LEQENLSENAMLMKKTRCSEGFGMPHSGSEYDVILSVAKDLLLAGCRMM
jgi:hypothetical protein